ncbi:MAG: thiolase domain-containing protein [Chloroflexota bacterium]
MTAVIVAGIGQTPVGEHWEMALRDLALQAMRAAIRDSAGLRPQALFVGNMLAPSLSNQAHLAVLLADFADLPGIEAVTLEAAGASGGAALRQGYLAVASGMVDVALVVGVEKFTDRVGARVDSALATASDSDFEAVQGLTPTAQAAMLMQRYLHEHEVPADGLAGFALTAHANGEGNPNAMFRKAIKPETYAKAASVNEPLRQFDIAPNADGAAAVVLATVDLLPKAARRPLVRIAGSASTADRLALHDRQDILQFECCRLSAEKALKRADVSLESVDLFEYHDAYSIYAALSLEAVGFAERGLGWKLAADGDISRGGRIPAATMGGLKARGFPGGATGVYQAVEATMQLQGGAGVNQVQNATRGLIQSVGGPGSTVITHVLERMD